MKAAPAAAPAKFSVGMKSMSPEKLNSRSLRSSFDASAKAVNS